MNGLHLAYCLNGEMESRKQLGKQSQKYKKDTEKSLVATYEN
jgi:hypothetical protein